MSETVSPKPSAPDGLGHDGPPKENPTTSQPENDNQFSQLPPYPTPNPHPPTANGQPQPPNSSSQQLEQLPTPQQNAESIRKSPTAQPASVPPSLPSIQAINRPAQMLSSYHPHQPLSQPPQPQPPYAPAGQHMPANNPPPLPQMASMNQFYSAPPTANIHHQDQINFGTIPPAGYQEQDKLLSGGRHKKEVKRRTKTGCLTCRKRRIKCDEAHPVCRNCVKSKRECLGYDPVFRSQPAPSAIQPAPNPPPSLVVAPQNPSSYPPIPAGYVAASAAPPLVTSLPSESPTPSLGPLEHATSVDFLHHTSNSPPAPPTQNPTEGNSQHQATPVPPPPVPAAIPPMPPAMPPPNPPGQKIKKANALNLVCLGGVPPPPKFPVKPIEPSRSEEVKAVFLTYAGGADRFLETKWFQEKALSLLEDTQRQAQFSGLIDSFLDPNIGDPNVLARANSLETSVVWEFLRMCELLEEPVAAGGSPPPPSFSRLLAFNRLRVIEALVTGDYLDINPVPMSDLVIYDDSPSLMNQLRQREFEFWSNLGHLVTLRDGEGDATNEIDAALGRCRSLLDTYENRDVIYSIAIGRVIGHRWADLPANSTHLANGEERNGAGTKLYIAQRFLEDEASGKATTQVIKRVCGMVLQSWSQARMEV